MLDLQCASLIEGRSPAQGGGEIVEVDEKVIPAIVAGGRRLQGEHGAGIADAKQGTAILMEAAGAADHVGAVTMLFVVRLAEVEVLGEHFWVIGLRKRPQAVGMARLPRLI